MANLLLKKAREEARVLNRIRDAVAEASIDLDDTIFWMSFFSLYEKEPGRTRNADRSLNLYRKRLARLKLLFKQLYHIEGSCDGSM